MHLVQYHQRLSVLLEKVRGLIENTLIIGLFEVNVRCRTSFRDLKRKGCLPTCRGPTRITLAWRAKALSI